MAGRVTLGLGVGRLAAVTWLNWRNAPRAACKGLASVLRDDRKLRGGLFAVPP
jgi:hypothetical protein